MSQAGALGSGGSGGGGITSITGDSGGAQTGPAITLTGGGGITTSGTGNTITITGSGGATPSGPGTSNLSFGFDLATSTFSVTGATAPLSVGNPGTVTLQSVLTPYEFVTYTITADQSFVDANGSSTIIGNTFGWTSAVAIDEAVPFYVYAVQNLAETTVKFMLARYPHYTQTGFNIGCAGGTLATQQTFFWSFETITTNDYQASQALCLGGFTMTMDSSNDWALPGLRQYFGLGHFMEGVMFNMPKGQLGAVSTGWNIAASGAPVFSTYTLYQYAYDRDGSATIQFSMTGQDTIGSGSDAFSLALPAKAATTLCGIANMIPGTGINSVFAQIILSDELLYFGTADGQLRLNSFFTVIVDTAPLVSGGMTYKILNNVP